MKRVIDIVNPLVSGTRPTPERNRNRSLFENSGAIPVTKFCGNVGAEAMVETVARAGFPTCIRFSPVPSYQVLNDALKHFISDRGSAPWVPFISLISDTLYCCFASDDDALLFTLMI